MEAELDLGVKRPVNNDGTLTKETNNISQRNRKL